MCIFLLFIYCTSTCKHTHGLSFQKVSATLLWVLHYSRSYELIMINIWMKMTWPLDALVNSRRRLWLTVTGWYLIDRHTWPKETLPLASSIKRQVGWVASFQNFASDNYSPLLMLCYRGVSQATVLCFIPKSIDPRLALLSVLLRLILLKLEGNVKRKKYWSWTWRESHPYKVITSIKAAVLKAYGHRRMY